MRIISLANQKGGVAKTTTAGVLSAGLVHRGYKVLVVDLDPQYNLTKGSGIDLHEKEFSLYDVFKGKADLQDIICKSAIGYDLIAGGMDLAGADMDFTQTGREFMLSEELVKVQDDYDYCIIDTPPTIGILTVNALTVSNGVIIPLTADAYPIEGMAQLKGLIDSVRKYSNKNLAIEGLLITNHEGRTNVSKAIMESIQSIATTLDTKIYEKPISHGVAVRESQLMKADLLTEAPNSKVAKDYEAFIDEFLKGEKDNGK